MKSGRYGDPAHAELLLLDELNAAAVQIMVGLNDQLELSRESDRRTNEQTRLNREAAEKLRTEAQDSQIREWVIKHGTTDQQERQKAKVLPREEIVDCIRGYAFSVLDRFDRYDRLQAPDVCESEYSDECADVSFDVENAESVTSEQWQAIQEIEAELSQRDDVITTIRRHYGECDCGCDGKAERFSIRVEITVDAFTFSREYAVSGAEEDDEE
jgi:hypothetical protein